MLEGLANRVGEPFAVGAGIKVFPTVRLTMTLQLSKTAGILTVSRPDRRSDRTGRDRINNRFAPIGPRHNMTRRYPATHRLRLEPRYDGIGDSFVLFRVT